MSTTNRERAVDGLRAIAVLLVVAHHAGLLPVALGTRGVDLFFAISGFCLALPTMRGRALGVPTRFDRGRFLRDRFLRIAPPYYAALAIFALLATTRFGWPTSLQPPMPFEWLADSLSLTSASPAYNASFWTIGVEAHWYLFFPILLAVYARSRIGFAILGAACYAAYAWQPNVIDFGTMPCFMLGIVAADLYARGKTTSPAFTLATLAILPAAIAIDRGNDHGDPLWHLAAALTLLTSLGPLRVFLRWKPLVFIGVASYSIYLVHQPLFFLFVVDGATRPLAAAFAVVAGIAFWRLVETPSLAMREWITKRRSAIVSRTAAATPVLESGRAN
jgi:peptidoglycan/LPS O-acetylase OafA/YrhL